MNIVIIGYGSIGRRHAEILKKFFKSSKIFIYSKQKIKKFPNFNNLNYLKIIKPQYVIIASETFKHEKQLKYLEKNFKGIKILVEKPVFHKYIKLKLKNNKVYVGYNLRFHPFIIKLHKILKKNKIYDIQFITNSYLPNWRKNISYQKNYTASKSKGGGIILDLSHELDLIHLFFKKIKINYVSFGKKSNLKINTEDYIKLFGKAKKTQITLDLKYYSKNELRLILVDGIKFSIFIDLKKNIFNFAASNKKQIIHKNYNSNKTFIDMHKAIISNKNSKFLCSYNEGMNVLKTIKKIKLRKY